MCIPRPLDHPAASIFLIPAPTQPADSLFSYQTPILTRPLVSLPSLYQNTHPNSACGLAPILTNTHLNLACALTVLPPTLTKTATKTRPALTQKCTTDDISKVVNKCSKLVALKIRYWVVSEVHINKNFINFYKRS